MSLKKLLIKSQKFDWDKGNIDKNWKKHQIANQEAEEIFGNEPLLISKDLRHSQHEQRYIALGKTKQNKKLFISFTVRKYKIRIISARQQDKQERRKYASK